VVSVYSAWCPWPIMVCPSPHLSGSCKFHLYVVCSP
jgi:hypothetical protein